MDGWADPAPFPETLIIISPRRGASDKIRRMSRRRDDNQIQSLASACLHVLEFNETTRCEIRCKPLALAHEIDAPNRTKSGSERRRVYLDFPVKNINKFSIIPQTLQRACRRGRQQVVSEKGNVFSIAQQLPFDTGTAKETCIQIRKREKSP